MAWREAIVDTGHCAARWQNPDSHGRPIYGCNARGAATAYRIALKWRPQRRPDCKTCRTKSRWPAENIFWNIINMHIANNLERLHLVIIRRRPGRWDDYGRGRPGQSASRLHRATNEESVGENLSRSTWTENTCTSVGQISLQKLVQYKPTENILCVIILYVKQISRINKT